MRAFRKLLAAGHSLLIIEHNLDVIRAADWLIDLGPEGGDAGGQIVGVGTPEDLTRIPASHTGQALADYTSAIVYEDKSQQARLLAEPTGEYGGSGTPLRSEEHTSELQSLMRISYAVFCLKKKKNKTKTKKKKP